MLIMYIREFAKYSRHFLKTPGNSYKLCINHDIFHFDEFSKQIYIYIYISLHLCYNSSFGHNHTIKPSMLEVN